MLSWLMAGSAMNLLICLLTTLTTAVWGFLLSSIFLSSRAGLVDTATVLIDTFIAVPTILVALLVAVPAGPTVAGLVAVISFGYGLNFARIIKPTMVRIAQSDYVEFARLHHVKRRTILTRHVLPNVIPVCSVQLSLSAATSILAEVALTYLGVGLPDVLPSWGRALAVSSQMIAIAPMSVIWAGFVVTVCVVAIHCFGDALGQAIDPLTNIHLRALSHQHFSALYGAQLEEKSVSHNALYSNIKRTQM